ncbi:MAG: long-chain fatty acid--CoA ligase [Dehalococcoidia bacterium]|nr:long-chain fatty acid--CoA ligase [Dehalococcoidia bacterium]
MMDDYQLTLVQLLERLGTYFPDNDVVTRLADGTIHRYTYRDCYNRSHQLSNALRRLGVKEGDRVGTLGWNTFRHMEAYLAIPTMGAVLHTLNLRLHPHDLAYIADHAGDSVIIADRSLLPLLEQFKGEVKSLRHVIVMPDDGPTPEGYLDYEQLIAGESTDFAYPDIDERSAAAMCYTSGTTGHPKGVVYGHRSSVLHSLTAALPDALGLSERDRVLPVVPMFHANAWSLPYGAALTGASMIFPGPVLQPPVLLDLMAAEKVTIAAGVPTIWNGVLALLDQDASKWDISALRYMLVGGSAAPPAMIEGFKKRHGLDMVHAWGMTEMSPIGSLARVKNKELDAGPEVALGRRASQGYAVPFVDTRHVDDAGTVLPWDGQTMGELEVRGPWVAATYYNNDEQADRFTPDGWFKTGDIVTIDSEGYITITDRSKDVIKSGGEWISTVALENAIMAHPAIMEAAVFAARHPKWDERPLAAVVFKPGQEATKDELNAFLEKDFAKFWLPDDYLVVPEIPKTSVGKFQKIRLREEYGEYLMKGN